MTSERKGEAFIIAGDILWSTFPIVTALSLTSLSPLASLGWSTVLSTIFFGVIVGARKKWAELANRRALKYVAWVVLLIGVLFYGFYFFGIKHTSPGNAALIGQLEVLSSFLFFNVWRKEYIARTHLFGVLLMVLGAVIVLLPNANSVNAGDFLVMTAMLFAPLGNHFQQKARKEVSSETIMFARSLLASPIIFLLAVLLGDRLTLDAAYRAWPALVFSGFALFGLSKIFWIEAIHRISVTKAVAIGGMMPLLTLLLSWMVLGQRPTIFQLLAFVPLFFGILLITTRVDKNAA